MAAIQGTFWRLRPTLLLGRSANLKLGGTDCATRIKHGRVARAQPRTGLNAFAAAEAGLVGPIRIHPTMRSVMMPDLSWRKCSTVTADRARSEHLKRIKCVGIDGILALMSIVRRTARAGRE